MKSRFNISSVSLALLISTNLVAMESNKKPHWSEFIKHETKKDALPLVNLAGKACQKLIDKQPKDVRDNLLGLIPSELKFFSTEYVKELFFEYLLLETKEEKENFLSNFNSNQQQQILGIIPEQHPNIKLKHHEDIVNTAEFSPDGKLIVSGGVDTNIIIWDIINQQKCVASAHQDTIQSIKFAPQDAKYFISASGDKTSKVFEFGRTETGEIYCNEINSDIEKKSIYSIQISPSHKYIAKAVNKIIKIYDQSESFELSEHTKLINSLQFTSDEKFIISASEDKTIKVWDLENKRCIFTFHANSPINSMTLSPSNKLIACTLSDENSIKILELNFSNDPIIKQLKELTNINMPLDVSFSPNGEILASTHYNATIKLWDLTKETNNFIGDIEGHKDSVNSVNFSPNGRYIVSTSNDKSVIVWDLWHYIG